MKYLLTLLLVFVYKVICAQQEIVLCEEERTEFTYTVSANVPLTSIYWYVDGVLQFGQQLTINWQNYDPGEHTLLVYGFVGECRSAPLSYKVFLSGCSTIYIPNVFTPSGKDGINDTWYPIGTGWRGIQVMVFDRWGELVFESTDINGQWIGNFRGGEYYVQNDVYVYKVIWTNHEYETETIYGHVTVVR